MTFLVSRHFYDPLMLCQRENFQRIQIGPVYVEICFHGLLILFLVQFLTSDVCNAYWGHDDVIKGHRCFFNNSWPGEDSNVKLVPVCLSRQDGSNGMQHDHTWLWPWPWPNLVTLSNFKWTFRGHLIYHSNRLDEIKTIVPISFLWLKEIKSY